MERSQQNVSVQNLMDTHNRLVADILTRYRTLMMLATIQADGERNNASPEAIAVTGISMKTEFEALYAAIKELLILSRKIKELWIFGPLGRQDPDRMAKEEQISENVMSIVESWNKLQGTKLMDLAVQNGGTWEPLGEGDNAETQASGTAPAAAS